MPTKRLALLFATVSMLAACASNPPPTKPAEPAGGSEPAVQREAPPPPPAPAPVVPPPPASASAQQQAQRTAVAAAESLERGNEDQAKTELQRALALDGNNKLALNLMRQITSDPQALLGRESFSYTVRPGETLSLIARRFMGDLYSFYILARYNDIKVPRLVAGGQVLRVPGKPPAPGSERERDRESARPAPAPAPPPPFASLPAAPAPGPTAPSPAPAPPPPPPPPAVPPPSEVALNSAASAEKAGDLDRALIEYRRAASLDHPQAAAKAEQVRKQLVTRHTGNARSAFAKQDLNGAIRNWDRVIELDPGNDNAKLERQKAITLKDKLEKMK